MRLSLLLVPFALLAQDAPKLTDAMLKERWKAMAVHHSNTIRYLDIQADLVKSKAAYEKAMADIKAACGDAGVDDSGPEVTCKVVSK